MGYCKSAYQIDIGIITVYIYIYQEYAVENWNSSNRKKDPKCIVDVLFLLLNGIFCNTKIVIAVGNFLTVDRICNKNVAWSTVYLTYIGDLLYQGLRKRTHTQIDR